MSDWVLLLWSVIITAIILGACSVLVIIVMCIREFSEEILSVIITLSIMIIIIFTILKIIS